MKVSMWICSRSKYQIDNTFSKKCIYATILIQLVTCHFFGLEDGQLNINKVTHYTLTERHTSTDKAAIFTNQKVNRTCQLFLSIIIGAFITYFILFYSQVHLSVHRRNHNERIKCFCQTYKKYFDLEIFGAFSLPPLLEHTRVYACVLK